LGVDGEIDINEPDVDPTQNLLELPQNLVDTSQKFDEICSPRRQADNSFIYTGRGGLPLSPDEPLTGLEIIENWVYLPSQTALTRQDRDKFNVPSLAKYSRKIVEAQKIVVDKNGDTYLVAEFPRNIGKLFVTSCSF